MIQTKKLACNFCGSNDYRIIVNARDFLHGINGEFEYVKCNNCGLLYMNPQVIAEDIKKLYPDDYNPHATDFQENNDKINHLKTIIKKTPLLHIFLNEMFCLDKSIQKLLNEKSRVLDIGCGKGEFLINLKKSFGCNVYGIDLSENAVTEARNRFDLKIFNGTAEKAPFPDNHFDIVTGWQYFEHVSNPNAVMAKINDLLKLGGHCVLSMPNADGFNFKLFKKKWYHLDCPRHLCLWSSETITKIFSNYGFKVEKIVHDKTPWGFLGSLQYVVYGNNTRQKNRNKIRRSSLLMILFAPWTIILSLFKKSDSIVIYARKTKSLNTQL